MSRIMVVGASGMLGHAMVKYFHRHGDDVVPITRREFDIARDPIAQLDEHLAECDAVVNCAGVIKPRIADTPIEDVLRINAVFPQNLARIAGARNIPCIHVTTDCVYSGNRGGYSETDIMDADDVYGLSKAGGDGAACMVLRTSIIGEEDGQQRSLLEWVRSQARKSVNGFTNHRWNGVTTLHLSEVVAQILGENRYAKQIAHVFSPEVLTKEELVRLISAVYRLDLKVAPAEASVPCDRSLTSIRTLSQTLCTKSLRVQLEEMYEFFRSA